MSFNHAAPFSCLQSLLKILCLLWIHSKAGPLEKQKYHVEWTCISFNFLSRIKIRIFWMFAYKTLEWKIIKSFHNLDDVSSIMKTSLISFVSNLTLQWSSFSDLQTLLNGQPLLTAANHCFLFYLQVEGH